MTPPEKLRAAEQRLRDVAAGATSGPWRSMLRDRRADVVADRYWGDQDGQRVATAADAEFGACSLADAAYIAAMSPPVALVLADLLGASASGLTINPQSTEWLHDYAVKVTDAVLAGSES